MENLLSERTRGRNPFERADARPKSLLGGERMDYVIDRDPTHRVLRLTVTTEVVTKELADDFNRALLLVASRDGPYASIHRPLRSDSYDANRR